MMKFWKVNIKCSENIYSLRLRGYIRGKPKEGSPNSQGENGAKGIAMFSLRGKLATRDSEGGETKNLEGALYSY